MLQAYEIDGNAVGIEAIVWKEADLNGKAPFIFADALEVGYRDITSIKNIYEFGLISDRDYKYVRDQIKQFVLDEGEAIVLSTQTDPSTFTPNEGDAYLIGASAVGDWSGKDGQYARWLSSAWVYYVGEPGGASPLEELGTSLLTDAEDMKISATYLIGSIPQQLAAFGFDFQAKEKAQLEYKTYVQDCRGKRYKVAENDMLQKIPQYAGYALADVMSGMYHLIYRDQGIDGTDYGDLAEGLSNWLLGTGSWDGSIPGKIGLINKGWTTLQGQDMAQYVAYLKDKLFEGGIIKGVDY